MCVYVRVCIVVVTGADRCIPLTMLVDVCQCCRLLICVCLPPFETLSLLLNLVNKESEPSVSPEAAVSPLERCGGSTWPVVPRGHNAPSPQHCHIRGKPFVLMHELLFHALRLF